MTRFALHPRWLAWHLLLVTVLVSFTWLGRWQLGVWSDAGPTSTAGGRTSGGDPAAAGRGPVALDSVASPGGRLTAAQVGVRVRTDGSYDPAGTVLVAGRERPGGGGRPGFLVVSCLRTDRGVLPVVRGWVARQDSAAAATPAGPVQVTGLLQASEDGPPAGSGGSAGSGGLSGPGQLPYVATVTLLDALPYRADRLYDGYLALRGETNLTRATVETVAPVPVTAVLAQSAGGGVGRWRNFAYALQWWLFAGAAVFFWWIVLRRAALEQQPGEPGSSGSLLAPQRTT